MRVIGFNFNKISAEKNSEDMGNLGVNSNIHIDSIERVKNEILKEGEALTVKFDYSIDYSPNVGKISFEGSILFLVGKKEAEKIISQWNDDKIINEELRPILFNFIFGRSNIKALELEQELNLPFHIPMPQITKDSLSPDKDAKKKK